MATDALSDLLKTVRLTGAAYFEIAAQEPWSVRSPAREMILPRILPGADHLIAYRPGSGIIWIFNNALQKIY